MNIELLLMYTIVSFFYVISPGPAVFLAISNGIRAGMTTVAISSLGNITGLFLLSTLSILGLGALLAASSTLFLIVKIIGASYLVYLGIKQFRLAKRAKLSVTEQMDTSHRSKSAYFYEGFLLAATNPKPILFFAALFPQFLDLNTSIVPQFFAMTGIFMAISFLSLFSYGYISKSAKSLFGNSKGMAWFHRVTGGLFVGMGFGLLQLKSAQS